MPLVLQYNKQDLPEIMTAAELNKTLNPWGRPALAAVAAQGKGVIECFVAVVQDMLAAIAVKYNLKEKGLDPASVPGVVQDAFAEVLKTAAAAAPAAAAQSSPRAAKVVVSHQTDSLHAAPPQTGSETGLVSEELSTARSARTSSWRSPCRPRPRDEPGAGRDLTQAELLMFYREDARKRQVAIAAIQREAAGSGSWPTRRSERSRGGVTSDPLATRSGPPRPRCSSHDPGPAASRPGPAAARAAPAVMAAPVATANGSLHELLRTSWAARRALDAQELSVELRILRRRSAGLPAHTLRQASREPWKASSPLPSAAPSSRCAASASRSSSRDATARSSAIS